MAKKRGLGRGLDALLSNTGVATAQGLPDSSGNDELKQLPVDLLERGRYQPRTTFDQDSLQSLADSIKSQGIVQPLVVRRIGDSGRYEIVAGERRWRAAQAAGLNEVPAVIRDIPDDAALAIALIENIQREDLNPLEEARALRQLIDEFEMTHQAAADAVGRSRAAVSNTLRLLDLDPDVADRLAAGELDMGHARALLTLDGVLQRQAAERIISQNLTARQAEALARSLLAPPAEAEYAARPDADVRKLQDSLSQYLGAAVNLQHRRNGKGKLTITYADLDQLDGILVRIGMPGESEE